MGEILNFAAISTCAESKLKIINDYWTHQWKFTYLVVCHLNEPLMYHGRNFNPNIKVSVKCC